MFLRFLKRLVGSTRRKVFLIVDGHPAHKVEPWVQFHRHQIRLFYLPKYSSELNPDELINNDVKNNAVGRRRARTPNELEDNMRSYFRSTQNQPQIVKAYFQEESVRYAAA